MSILIKGMKMPKNCIECPFMALANTTDGRLLEFCSVSEMFVVGIETQKDPKCPLIELPPHGGLIDRSKLAWTPIDITDLPFGECLPVYLKEDVDNALIVVESEE